MGIVIYVMDTELKKRIEERCRSYEQLTRELAQPEVVGNRELYQQKATEHAELREIVELYREFKRKQGEHEEVCEFLHAEEDTDIAALAAEEREQLEGELKRLEQELSLMLAPRDAADAKNVVMEIRSGTGGEEAALFAAELFRMYQRYCETKGWHLEVISSHPTEIGGMKEIIFSVTGKDVYARLKHESGVHRVQRVPVTEAGGRIHTSTVTVAVLPEAGEVDVEINQNDLKIDLFRASGPGGQHVNKTESAVRITHLPTGLVVSCQDEKSQHKNKARALKVLRARLYDLKLREHASKIDAARRNQVGTGDRSERIRTYNFPQNRVTDHRIGLTLHKLDHILDGELDEIIEALRLAAVDMHGKVSQR